jgi:hypothetical protein
VRLETCDLHYKLRDRKTGVKGHSLLRYAMLGALVRPYSLMLFAVWGRDRALESDLICFDGMG